MTAEIFYMHTLSYIYFFSNSISHDVLFCAKSLFRSSDGEWRRMEANRKATKAKLETNKQRMKQFHANSVLSEQSTYSDFIRYEGN